MADEVMVQVQKVEKANEPLWAKAADNIHKFAYQTSEHLDHSMRGAHAMGAEVVMLSRNDKIKAEFKKHLAASRGKKGRPPVIISWVARTMTAQWDGLPAHKHLAAAANAALEYEKGKRGSIKDLLGWNSKAGYGETLLEEQALPASLPAPKGNGKDTIPPTLPIQASTVINKFCAELGGIMDAAKENKVNINDTIVGEAIAEAEKVIVEYHKMF